MLDRSAGRTRAFGVRLRTVYDRLLDALGRSDDGGDYGAACRSAWRLSLRERIIIEGPGLLPRPQRPPRVRMPMVICHSRLRLRLPRAHAPVQGRGVVSPLNRVSVPSGPQGCRAGVVYGGVEESSQWGLSTLYDASTLGRVQIAASQSPRCHPRPRTSALDNAASGHGPRSKGGAGSTQPAHSPVVRRPRTRGVGTRTRSAQLRTSRLARALDPSESCRGPRSGPDKA
jgi:hypothetical protein